MNPGYIQSHYIKTGVFTSTWKTDNLSTGSSANNQVKLPLQSNGSYKFYVDWGDGTSDFITTWNQAETTHTYSSIATYTVKIRGLIIGWSFNGTEDRLKILTITRWGCLRLGNNGSYFNGCANLTCGTISDILNLKGTTILSSMFFGCTSITTVGRMNEWNLSGVTKLNSMFAHFVGGGTTGLGLFNQDIGAWNVSNVDDFNNMFRFNAFFNNGNSSNIQNWNVSSAINMEGMFSRANRFNQPIANWERTTPGNTSTLANVTNMANMFSSSNNALGFNQPIGNWNVSSVINMNNMFYRSPFNQDIGSWNISNVTNFTAFGTAGSVSPFSPTTLDLIYNGWSTRPVSALVGGIQFSSKYTTASSAGRATLGNICTPPPNGTGIWNITDGGL